ncbi:MAG: hypothetical protein IPK85_01910 [Gemmatimonadetes bacterium]|nr:hypothetical protein [Gemmatimonadota bacterium]
MSSLNLRPVDDLPLGSRRGRRFVAYCRHDSDPYVEPARPNRLTIYGAWCEDNGHVQDGWCVVEWGGAFTDSEDDGGAHMPDWWFLAGTDFEIAANPTHFLDIELPAVEVTP